MTTCDDYQLSFEMQLHGAPPVIPREEIREHITSCSSCTAYVAATQETATMNTTNWIEHDGFDSARLVDRVRSELNPTLRERLPSYALAAVLGGLTFALVWLTDYTLSFGVIGGVAAGLVVALSQRRALRQRWAQLADAPAGDLIGARRNDLARRHRWNVAAIMLMGALLVVYLANGDLRAPTVWFQAGAVALIIVIALVQELRDRRELRELGA